MARRRASRSFPFHKEIVIKSSALALVATLFLFVGTLACDKSSDKPSTNDPKAAKTAAKAATKEKADPSKAATAAKPEATKAEAAKPAAAKPEAAKPEAAKAQAPKVATPRPAAGKPSPMGGANPLANRKTITYDEALKKLQEVADGICACKDKACVMEQQKKVMAFMRSSAPDPTAKPTPEQNAKMQALGKKMKGCADALQKQGIAGPPKPAGAAPAAPQPKAPAAPATK